jgi:RNA polymerase sigma-70 factor (ECF subfamily)
MRMLRVTPAEDGTLVKRARAGDREAFGEFYEQYVGRVYRYLLYMARDVDVAQDLTEQTFLQALAAIDRYERRGVPFVAWLLRIAHNLYVNGRHVQRDSSLIRDNQNGKGESPELPREASARAEEVMQAVQALSRDQREVIILRFIEGLSYADTARILGKSVGAVRAAQYRALCALRQRLEDGDLGQHSPRSG